MNVKHYLEVDKGRKRLTWKQCAGSWGRREKAVTDAECFKTKISQRIKGTPTMAHKIPFMRDKKLLQIYAHNENPRASAEKTVTAVGTGFRVFSERME